MALFNRSLPALRRRYGRPFLIFSLLIIFLDAIIITNSYSPATPQETPPAVSSTEKIFISSIFRNNEYMLRLHWSSNLVKLIQHLGPQNVYVSIVESGSQEDTKGALVDLQNSLNALGVANRIELGETVDEQAESLLHVPEEGNREGWMFTGRKKIEGGWEVRRIPYLAKLRNQAMEPLEILQKEGKIFEKVLWINDVIFTTEDVTTLLNTNQGHYAAACSFDFSHAPHYYDTFALRDALGYKTASLTFPYFYSSVSRSALISSPGEIPVQSCWNGMIAFDARPFYPTPGKKTGLKFRGVSDELAKKHVEGSECCLIHADNPLSSTAGVYLNANVRVAYNESAYTYANPGAVFLDTGEGFARKVEWPHGRGRWPGRLEMVVGTWGNRLNRWMGGARLWSDRRVVERRVGKWMRDGAEEREIRREAGIMCLINEMQVLFENGWQHV